MNGTGKELLVKVMKPERLGTQAYAYMLVGLKSMELWGITPASD